MRGGGGLYWTRFPAKQLRLSCSQSPRPESSHFFGGGRWGAARPCSRGGRSRFFHHQEDALREGTAGSPRRFSASVWPGNPLHTHSSRQRNWGLQRSLARPAPGTRLFCPARNPGRENPRRRSSSRAKRRPGGCSYAPLPTPSGCNALGPASARPLPACAGLVSTAVCRCGSSPSPRRPPPRSAQLLPPPWGLKMRGPIYSGVARASIRSAEAVAIPAPSARVRMRGSERSGHGAPTPGKLGFLCVLLPGSTAHFCSRKELVAKFGQKSPSGFPLRSAPPGSAPPAPGRNPGRTRASERTEDSDTALGLPTPGAPIPSGLRLLPHQGSNKSFWPRGQRRSFSFPEECAGGASSPRFPPTMEMASLVL